MDDEAEFLRGIRRDEDGHPVLKEVRLVGGRVEAPGAGRVAHAPVGVGHRQERREA